MKQIKEMIFHRFLTKERIFFLLFLLLSYYFFFTQDLLKYFFLVLFTKKKEASLYLSIFYYSFFLLIPFIIILLSREKNQDIKYLLSYTSREKIIASRIFSLTFYISLISAIFIILIELQLLIKGSSIEQLSLMMFFYLFSYILTIVSLFYLIPSISIFNIIILIFILLNKASFSLLHYFSYSINSSVLLKNTIFTLLFGAIFLILNIIKEKWKK